MFLNYIKNFSVKKVLKNSLHNVKSSPFSGTIKTIGLLIDESYFLETKALVKELISKGILEDDIEVLIYKDKLKNNRIGVYPAFSSKNLNWNTTINSTEANDFIAKEFDVLINYYDLEKTIVMLVSHNSKAKFKVGFSTIDKRLNDLIINTTTENYIVFTHELFRYLKILNKI